MTAATGNGTLRIRRHIEVPLHFVVVLSPLSSTRSPALSRTELPPFHRSARLGWSIARYSLGLPGWRDDQRTALAMARRADPMSYTGVTAYVYFAGILSGMRRPDDSAMRDIEDAVQIAERSGDDVALAFAWMTLSVALVHRPTDAEHERGRQLLAKVSEKYQRRGQNVGLLPAINVCSAREMVRRGDREEAIPLLRAAADELFRGGRLQPLGAVATGVLMETLLDRWTDGGLEAD